MNNYSLTMFSYAVPYILLDVAGITYAAVQWDKHARLSMLVIASLGISIVKTGLMSVFYMLTGSAGVPSLFGAVRAADVLIGIGAHGLLIYAVFFGFREGRQSVKENK